MITRKLWVATLFAIILTVVCAASYADDNTKLAAKTTMVNLELKNTTVKAAIEAMFKGTGVTCHIGQGVVGTVVELRLKGLTLDQAVHAIADEAGFAVVFENGAYTVGLPSEVSLGRTTKARPVTEDLSPLPELATDSTGKAIDPTKQASVDSSGTAIDPASAYPGQLGPYSYQPQMYQFGQLRVVNSSEPIVLGSQNPGGYTTTLSPSPIMPLAPQPYIPQAFGPIRSFFPTPYRP